MTSNKVLLWLLDPLQQRYLQQIYQNAGFDVLLCQSFLQLKKQALAQSPQALALVFNLPHQPETTFKQIRSLHQQLPLACQILISLHQDPLINQAALAAGADDCLLQPFETTELLARTQSRLQRIQSVMRASLQISQASPLVFGPFSLNPQSRLVAVAGQQLKLTPTEFALLHLLARHANQRINRAQIYQLLWQTHEPIGSRRLDNFIFNLRQKLPPSPDWELMTYYGEGFGLKLNL